MNKDFISIVGMGLLGGSYAMGLSRAGKRVFGLDVQQKSIDFAIKKGYIEDGEVGDGARFLALSDLVILCLPPAAVIPWVEKHLHLLQPGTLLSDVSGVKRGLVEPLQALCAPRGIEFYGGHPMRGRETLGIENADCAIFEGGNYILTPSAQNTAEAEQRLRALAHTLGFTTVRTLDAEAHDRMVAYLSQLTHAIAVSLMTASDEEEICDFSGDSFRDLTRIAKIDEYLWSELFALNADLLCENIERFVEQLQRLKGYIRADDRAAMQEMFRLSTKRRARFDKK